MADIQNTIDLRGDEVVANSIIDRTIDGDFTDDIVTTIASYAFYSCQALTSVNLLVATEVGKFAFNSCTALTSINLPAAVSIMGSAFKSASKLNLLILGAETVCALADVTAFNGTPFASGGTGGTVYVPAALIESYQNATNWSTLYAAGTCNFVAIEGSEYE